MEYDYTDSQLEGEEYEMFMHNVREREEADREKERQRMEKARSVKFRGGFI